MNTEQVRDLILVLLWTLPLLLSLIAFSRKQHKKLVQDTMKNIDDYAAKHLKRNNKVRFYTTGHPYFWTEVSADKLAQMVKDKSWLPVGHATGIPVPARAKYLLNCHYERNSIHIVFTQKKQFDWQSLKFYDDVVE